MAETNVPITPGSGATIATYTDTAGNRRQIVTLGDQNANTAGVFANGTGTAGQLRVALDPTQLFIDLFDNGQGYSPDQNRWAVSAGGTGSVPVNTGGQVVLSGGTTLNSFSMMTSVPLFIPDEPGWDLSVFRVNIEFPVLTTAYRFWGSGLTVINPTVAAPVIAGAGWEVTTAGHLCAVTYSMAGGRNLIADLNGTAQPADSLVHKYYLYFRGDLAYWAIDTVDNVVASFSTGASGPDVNTLPLKALVVSNSGTQAVLQLNGVSLGDTARNNAAVSDGVYPWRQATVKPAATPAAAADSALVVALHPSSPAPGVPVTGSELTVNSIYDELILRELRRVSAYLSQLTGEYIGDDDLQEYS